MGGALEVPLKPQVHVLDNGLTVLLDAFPDEPRVSWRVVVAAGAAMDAPGRSGTAHLVEHVLANKGSRRLGTADYAAERPLLDRIRPLSVGARDAPDRAAALDTLERAAWAHVIPNELKQIAGELGATGLNAATSHDRTWYRVELPKNRLAQWIEVDADRFAAPVVRAFATELQTVCEEKRRSLDNPDRELGEAMRRAAWGAHPYGRPILGTADEIADLDVPTLEDFLARWYRPAAMAVCASGDLDPDEALAHIAAHFGALPDPGTPLPDPPAAPGAWAPSRTTLEHDGDDELRLLWRTQPRSHADLPALALLHDVLCHSATGVLSRTLRHTRRVRAVGGGRRALRWGGLQILTGRPLEGQRVEDLEGLLREAVASVCAGGVDADDLEGLKTAMRLGDQRARERSGDRVARLARAFVHGEGWPEADAWSDRIAAVSRDDVVRVAQAYLEAEPAVVLRRRGRPCPPAVSPPAVSERPPAPERASAFRARIRDTPAPPLPPQRLRLGEDVRASPAPWGQLLAGDNPHNDLFSLSLVWEEGTDARRGLGAAGQLWGMAGAGALDRTALERRLVSLGLGISWRVRQRRAVVRLSGFSEALTAGLELLALRLRQPTIPLDLRARHLADVQQRRQERKADRDVAIGALTQLALHGEGSPWRGRSLSDAELDALAPDGDLSTWMAPFCGLPTTALAVGCGADGALIDSLGGLLAPERAPAAAAPVRYDAPAADRVWLVHHPAAQASVQVLQPQPPSGPDASIPRRLLAETWGGSAGLFFQEVREQRGWAYSVSGRVSGSGWVGDDSLRWAQAATDPERASAAAVVLTRLLRDTPVDAERFERARTSALEKLRGHRVGFRSRPGAFLGWADAGHGMQDPRAGWLDRLASVGQAEVEAWRRAGASRPVTVCIVGDLDRMDLDPLRALAEPEVRAAPDLFSY